MSARYGARLACGRCGGEQLESAAFGPCPRCLADGVPVNLAPLYDVEPGALPRAQQPGVAAGVQFRRLFVFPTL